MAFKVAINGHERVFASLNPPVPLAQLVDELKLQGDRVAVEHNGSIVQRAHWPHTQVAEGDRLEVVHFVGGGSRA